MNHEYFLSLAVQEARKAAAAGEIPVGAVLVHNGDVIARAGNTREGSRNALGHAELSVIREGCERLGRWRLDGCTLYVTLEPCPMCSGAILSARLDAVVYGASNPVEGCLGSRINLFEFGFPHRPRIRKGVLEAECTALLSAFFQKLRGEPSFDPELTFPE